MYCCDNLPLLRSLGSETIDCIYCDILFGTGQTFQDYSDKFVSKQEAKNFYLPRFYEMLRTLKTTGLCYIHCDYHLSHYIKIWLDEVFGQGNFRNEIIWWYNSAPRKKKDFGKRHEIIFRYSKTDDYYFDLSSQYIRQEYSPSAPRGYEKEKYYHPNGKVMDDVWKIPMLGQNDRTERVGYSTQKPRALMYPIIDSSCPPDGVFADFFVGSGTSCVVAQELGRSFIGCDINPKAIEKAKERLKL